MRVLLVNTPYPLSEAPRPPLGLTYIAGVLLREGIEVKILDLLVNNFSLEKIEKEIRGFNPQIVGATSVTMNFPKAIKILRAFKEIDPHVITIIGGPHATFDVEGTLSEPHIDIVVRGEGEETIVELMDVLRRGGDIKKVKGIAFRRDGEIIITPQRPFIPDLDTIPFPARHLLPISKYLALGSPCGVITSRGCPYSCIFCVGQRMVGKKVRFRKPNLVVDEIEEVVKMGFENLSIDDDLFTLNHKHSFSICEEIIKRKLNITWGAFARVDTISKDLLKKMKEAGCRTLCFGMESGNQKILNLIKKRITLEQIREAVRLSRELDYDIISSFIIGLPGESKRTLRETIEFAQSLGEGYGFHILAPFPGTEVRERAKEYGLKILTNDWECYDANRAVAETPEVKAEELNKIVEEYNRTCELIFSFWEEKAKAGELEDKALKKLKLEKSRRFVWQLISQEVIEREGMIRRRQNLEEDIAELQLKVWNALPFPLETVKEEVRRLIQKGYLKYELAGDYVLWKWNER